MDLAVRFIPPKENCSSPALLQATTAFFEIIHLHDISHTSLPPPMQSELTERQVDSCTFKYGNAPLLSAVSIPMNNQPQMHSTAAPHTSTEETKGTGKQRGETHSRHGITQVFITVRWRCREREATFMFLFPIFRFCQCSCFFCLDCGSFVPSESSVLLYYS